MSNKYESIAEYILEKVSSKAIKPGDRIPSLRHMSNRFKYSKSTILRAYRYLEEKHIIYSVPKSGYYLVDNNFIHDATNNDILDLSSATPDSSSLPYRDFQHSMNQAIDIYKENLFSYNDPQGLKTLRQLLSKFFYNYQIFTHTDNIFITTGTQQALDLLTRIPFPNGKENILVEQPTYSIMLKLLEINQATTLGIERTIKGIDFEELERLFKNENIKFFYTIPSLHNPLGSSLSIDEKKQILNLAQKYNVYIVEDDYLKDIDINTKSDPIFSLDQSNRIIYIKSFSKTLMPGLRIGAVILPKQFLNTFATYKKATDLNTPVLSQGALEIFIKSGMFNQHIDRVRKAYRNRMICLSKFTESLEALGIKSYIPDTGFFAWFHVPSYISIPNLKRKLIHKNVLISDSTSFFLPSFQRKDCFRLSICKSDEDKIEEALPIICKEIKDMIKI